MRLHFCFVVHLQGITWYVLNSTPLEQQVIMTPGFAVSVCPQTGPTFVLIGNLHLIVCKSHLQQRYFCKRDKCVIGNFCFS